MKKLFTLLFIPIISLSQGEQRSADGTATDQDGNTFEWINYGYFDFSIENAKVITYRDGTAIPQVTDPNEWANLTTGAWKYVINNNTETIVYNGYAVSGKHDNEDSTPNKKLAPEGWVVPGEGGIDHYYVLFEYLIENGYTNDGTSGNDKIAKSMSSKSGWTYTENCGSPGNGEFLNNRSGFNAKPIGFIEDSGYDNGVGGTAAFWSMPPQNGSSGGNIDIYRFRDTVKGYGSDLNKGFAVRFVRDASAASTTKNSDNLLTLFPNPTTSILTIEGNKEYYLEVYNLAGKKMMSLSGNTINMAHLINATYIVNAIDKETDEKLSYKVIKN